MAEYIEREAAIKVLREKATANSPSSFYRGLFTASYELDDIPAADVAPVRHGRWIEPSRLYYGAKQYECSLCCSDTFWNKHSITEKYPHCPNCGAKMDLED